jgi:hypothetical protein
MTEAPPAAPTQDTEAKPTEKAAAAQPVVIPAAVGQGAPARIERGFVLWWALKKWLWRNTAAGLWILTLWRVAGSPPFPKWLESQDAIALGVFFIFLITELQLTQLLWFVVYVMALPLWLPVFGLVQYVRRKMGRVPVGRSRLKIRLFRLCTVVILLSLFFWWPLPSPQVALGIGTLAFIPGFFLLRRTLRFALSPGRSLLDIRTAVDGAANALRKAEPASSASSSPETAAQVEGWKSTLLGFYDSHFLGGIEKGLLRSVAVLYFCVLLLTCLLYVGFLGALWLRALAPSPEALAAAVGRPSLPDLATMSFICSLGILGEWRIKGGGLGMPANVVIVFLNLARIVTSVVLVAAFFSSYSADIARVEADTRKQKAADKPEAP